MPKFTVIRASAGSGKTFSLTQEYLRLILTQPDNFRHILAVTFTNKATEEMKTRIIRELYLLSSGQETGQLEPLIRTTGFNRTEISIAAKNVLRQLLHQYSWFSVNTIDTFFQRIIRNFTRELGIQEGYIIELETDPVLTEIIDNLLVNAEHDLTLLKWLTLFAESLIEKGENWNLKKSIRKLGNEIFREEFKNLDNNVIDLLCDRELMTRYRNELFGLQRQIEGKYRLIGEKALEKIKSAGLSVDDFIRKTSGPAGFFAKIAAGLFEGPSDAVSAAALSADKWSARISPHRSVIERLAQNELISLLNQAREYYEQNITTVSTISVVLRNLFTLGILIDLSRLADSWCSENNTFLLPEAPVFLNRIIDGNDTPFIYEKSGTWFHHFMIDEFQDTSSLQWDNFKPLISNSLSQNHDNLAVGDMKQSIYRWRNSSWEILQNQIYVDFPSGIIQQVNLRENRRSGKNIVGFNNEFFARAAETLQQEFESRVMETQADLVSTFKPITDLYGDLTQRAAREGLNEGYVNVQFFERSEDPDFTEAVNRKLVSVIHSLLDKGYRLKDIAILARKNKEAADLAEYLLNYHEAGRESLRVISDEALLLGSSVVLSAVVSLFRHLADPRDANNNYYLETIIRNYLDGKADVAWQMPDEIRVMHQIRLPHEFELLIKGYKSFSLSEITEQIIRIFRLDKHQGELVYLMAFRDLILEYTRNHSSNVMRFLEFWDETGSKRSVAAPAGQDAVRVMTLHKSKGLEFKIVIIPFCTWDLNTFEKSFLWCRPDREPFNQLPVIPISFNKKLAKTIFATDYFKELQKQMMDNLNLMYVAFTRARDALYIFCSDPKGTTVGNASALVKRVLGGSYESGFLPASNSTEESNSQQTTGYNAIQHKDIKQRIRIAFQGSPVIDADAKKPARPINEGRILHEIFNRISRREDIRKAVDEMHIQGKIAGAETDRYIRLIENAMNDIQVSTWFTGDWKVLNEAEIILPGGDIRRPDRVMQRDNQTMIIDYKFGLKTETGHEQQVKDYAGILKTMGYVAVEGYLWYVRLGKVVQIKM